MNLVRKGGVLRIVFVITGLGVGGAERVVTELADYMVKAGHQVALVYLTGPAMVLPQHPAVELISVGMQRKWDAIFAVWKLREVIKNLKPDIVHAHLFHAIMVCRITRFLVRFPKLIDTIHSSKDGGKIRMFFYKTTDFLSDAVTNVSEESAKIFAGTGATRRGRKILVVQNGINTEKYKFLDDYRNRYRKKYRIKPKEACVLAVGRLAVEKNYHNFLQAMQIVGKTKAIRSFIVGDGGLRCDLENFLAKIDLVEHVKFLGVRDDVPALMCAADVFVLSSDYEGFGLVVAEAMACGCIVVATDCGGVREVLGDAGYLVPPRDHTALARAVIAALELDEQSRQELSERARRRIVENYSSEMMCEKYLALYEARAE